MAALRAAGIEVRVGLGAEEVTEQLAPYLKHRWTGPALGGPENGRQPRWPDCRPRRHQPLDHRFEAARDVHVLRSRSDAVLVGAGTVRADDPAFTVRPEGVRMRCSPFGLRWAMRRPVLGSFPPLELSGTLAEVLDELGQRGALQLLVEGGATVAHDFHAAGLVDRYVIYLAPALFGGDDGRPLFAGPGAGTLGMCGEGSWSRWNG